MKQRNIKLEEIEVLKEWDKRHLLKSIKKPVKPRKKAIPVDWALADSYMPEIAHRAGRLTSHVALRIVGANQSRTPHHVIYLPVGWRVDLPHTSKIALSQWNLPWIGLSWSLREDVALAAQVVRAIVASVRPAV
jgi:hypothetical protein